MARRMAWPKKGNKAFASADQGKSFYLNRFPFPFPQKPGAFKDAAEMVIEGCHAAGRLRFSDELFFPVAYLYRHGLELLLKDIIQTGVHLNRFSQHDVEEALTNHNLAKLWTKAKQVLVDRWPTADPTPLSATEAVINDFHQADPNGQVFRYDENKDGQRYRLETLPQNIGLDELRETMDGVFTLLSSAGSCLRDDLSNMMEAARGPY